jgi:hypothetical protein
MNRYPVYHYSGEGVVGLALQIFHMHLLFSPRIIFLAGIIIMQAWLTWLFISRQVHYWSDVMQSKRQKTAKKKEVKKKGNCGMAPLFLSCFLKT